MTLPLDPSREDVGMDALTWARRPAWLRAHGKGRPRVLTPRERAEARRRRRWTIALLEEVEEIPRRWRRYR